MYPASIFGAGLLHLAEYHFRSLRCDSSTNGSGQRPGHYGVRAFLPTNEERTLLTRLLGSQDGSCMRGRSSSLFLPCSFLDCVILSTHLLCKHSKRYHNHTNLIDQQHVFQSDLRRSNGQYRRRSNLQCSRVRLRTRDRSVRQPNSSFSRICLTSFAVSSKHA